MEFHESAEDKAFRKQLRDFLTEALPPDWSGDEFDDSEAAWKFGRSFDKLLGQHGWMAPAWPKEYGGMGLSYAQQAIFIEEMYYHRAPRQGPRTVAVGFVGPTIIVHGNEAQKKRHLGGITSGEVMWAEGFTEPGSGSDLASLQTRAVRDGDDFVITGRKIFTSHAHKSDWIFLLARTDPEAPKHKGISYFLIDLKTPGISFRPLVDMLGRYDFNETLLDNVRVPKENLLGEINRGWYYATTTLDFARSSLSGPASARRSVDDLVAYVRETSAGGRKLSDNPRYGLALADRSIEVEIARLLQWRVISIHSSGGVLNFEASVGKMFNCDLSQRVARTGIDILGMR